LFSYNKFLIIIDYLFKINFDSKLLYAKEEVAPGYNLGLIKSIK